MFDVICLGELLIDFISLQKGSSLAKTYGFKKAAGGAPGNVAVGLSRLGRRVGMISKVGQDPFGNFLINTLRENGVEVSQIFRDHETRTGLAFVSLLADGERDFVFYRHPSADMKLSASEINPEYVRNSKIFHFGSISLIGEESRKATLLAIQIARASGQFITYDPNLRIALWEDKETARNWILEGVRWATLVKINYEEMEFLTGQSDLDKGCEELLAQGPSMVVVTMGKKGCYYRFRTFSGFVPPFPVTPVDTTGAGDGFMAGLLFGILNSFSEGLRLEGLGRERMHSIGLFANAVGSMSTLKRGAIASLPDLGQVQKFVRRMGAAVI